MHGGEYTPVLQLLRDLMAERDRRKTGFQAAAPAGLVPDIGAYNRLARQRGTPTMPVLVVVIDEVQKLFVEGDFTQRREAARLIEEVAREGRAYGFTLLLSSQSCQGVDLPPAAASQFKLRLAFKLASEADCRRVLAQDNEAPLRLGDWQLLVNDDFGRPAANRTVRVDHLSPEAIHHRLQAVRERFASHCQPPLPRPRRRHLTPLRQPINLAATLPRPLPQNPGLSPMTDPQHPAVQPGLQDLGDYLHGLAQVLLARDHQRQAHEAQQADAERQSRREEAERAERERQQDLSRADQQRSAKAQQDRDGAWAQLCNCCGCARPIC